MLARPTWWKKLRFLRTNKRLGRRLNYLISTKWWTVLFKARWRYFNIGRENALGIPFHLMRRVINKTASNSCFRVVQLTTPFISALLIIVYHMSFVRSWVTAWRWRGIFGWEFSKVTVRRGLSCKRMFQRSSIPSRLPPWLKRQSWIF